MLLTLVETGRTGGAEFSFAELAKPSTYVLEESKPDAFARMSRRTTASSKILVSGLNGTSSSRRAEADYDHKVVRNSRTQSLGLWTGCCKSARMNCS